MISKDFFEALADLETEKGITTEVSAVGLMPMKTAQIMKSTQVFVMRRTEPSSSRWAQFRRCMPFLTSMAAIMPHMKV